MEHRPATEFFRLATELVDALIDRELLSDADANVLRMEMQQAVLHFAEVLRLLDENSVQDEYDTEGDTIMWTRERTSEQATGEEEVVPDAAGEKAVERAAAVDPEMVHLSFSLGSAKPSVPPHNTIDRRQFSQMTMEDENVRHVMSADGSEPLTADEAGVALWRAFADTKPPPPIRPFDSFLEPYTRVTFSAREVAAVVALDELFKRLTTFARRQARAFETRLADSLRERDVALERTRVLRDSVDETEREARRMRSEAGASPVAMERERARLRDRVEQLENERASLLGEIERRASITPRDAAYVRFVVSAYVAKETRFLEYLIAVLRNRHSGKRLLGRMQQHNAFVSRAGFRFPDIVAGYVTSREEALRQLYSLV